MIGGPIRHPRKRYRRRFEWVSGFKIDNARAALSGQNGRRHYIEESEGKCADERIVQPLGNLVAESLDVNNSIPNECAGFGVACINPSLRGGSRRPLRGVIAKYATG